MRAWDAFDTSEFLLWMARRWLGLVLSIMINNLPTRMKEVQ